MAVKSLAQIRQELGSIYNPQVALVQQRQSAIPETIQQEEAGLAAKQTQAFGDIVSGARRRGLGFSGIPLEEQARYTSTEYLPALARLRQSGRDQAMNLEEAILGIRERQNNMAGQLRQQYVGENQWERQFKEDRRRFGIQLAESRRQAARDAASSFSPTFGAGPSIQARPKTDSIQQAAYNDVATRINNMQDQDLKSDFFATASSAKYGNKRDLYKLQVYRKLRPDLFKARYSWEKKYGF